MQRRPTLHCAVQTPDTYCVLVAQACADDRGLCQWVKGSKCTLCEHLHMTACSNAASLLPKPDHW